MQLWFSVKYRTPKAKKTAWICQGPFSECRKGCRARSMRLYTPWKNWWLRVWMIVALAVGWFIVKKKWKWYPLKGEFTIWDDSNPPEAAMLSYCLWLLNTIHCSKIMNTCQQNSGSTTTLNWKSPYFSYQQYDDRGIESIRKDRYSLFPSFSYMGYLATLRLSRHLYAHAEDPCCFGTSPNPITNHNQTQATGREAWGLMLNQRNILFTP